MSEYLSYTEGGMPYFEFASNLGDMVSIPENSGIYLHKFEDRGADHLFVERAELDDEISQGVFMFRAEMELARPEFFEEIIGEMAVNGWAVFHCDEIAQCDQDVFDRFLDGKSEKVTNKKIKRWLRDDEKSV